MAVRRLSSFAALSTIVFTGFLAGCSGAGDDADGDDLLSPMTGGATGVGGDSYPASGGDGTGAGLGSGGVTSGGTWSGGATSGGATSGGAASGGEASGGAGTGGEPPATGGAASTGGAATGGAATGGAATGGAGTGGAATCSEPAPPQNMKETLDLTWKEMSGGFQGLTGARPVSASIKNFENTIIDQIMEGEGKLNYCVRYESTQAVSAELRAKIEAALERAINKWTSKLDGYGCFPYPNVEVEVTGWATWARDTLKWSDEGVPIYVNQNDAEGAPKCPDACSRFVHREPGYTYPGCAGGADNHFDMSLWLTDDFGFVGGDWGQRLDRDYFVNSVDADNQHIVIHEMGHGFGFPDYYNWSVWAPGVAAPACVMNAGAASQVTDWDAWMLRRTWSEISSRWL